MSQTREQPESRRLDGHETGRSGELPARSWLQGSFWPWLAIVAVLAVTVVVLRGHGRLWWCSCGGLQLWSSDAWSAHNSQHLFDPYSFTHLLHGILFFGILAKGLPRLSMSWRLALAVFIEVAWELFENSEFVIERYRSATASLGYQGDTIANSLGDILSCALGFVAARRLGFWGSLTVVVVTELVLLLCIKDNLLLNVVMLVHPIEAVKTWQMGL